MNRLLRSQYNDKCLTADLNNRTVRAATCDSSTLWQGNFDIYGSQYRHLATGQCLDWNMPAADLFISPCSSDDRGQLWAAPGYSVGPADSERRIAVERG